jgi:protein phosphatase
MLTDAEIEGVLTRSGSLEEMANELIVAANENGGNDNVTVVLLQAELAA